MRIRTVFFVALALLVFSCRRFKEVECTGVQGFKVNKLDTKGIDGDIVLKLKNPNAFGFALYRSEFDITYSGIYLGKAHLAERVRIKANQETYYPFNIKSEFKDIAITDIMKLLSGGSFKNQLDVKGDLRAGTLFIKKRFPVHVSEKIGLN